MEEEPVTTESVEVTSSVQQLRTTEATFSAEAFNMINHPNFGNPASSITVSNVGQVTATSIDNRVSNSR